MIDVKKKIILDKKRHLRRFPFVIKCDDTTPKPKISDWRSQFFKLIQEMIIHILSRFLNIFNADHHMFFFRNFSRYPDGWK